MNIVFKQSGLTMLEVIFSMGIVMVGMLGVVTLLQQNIVAQNINKNSLLSAALAQETVELLRNQRDTNQRNESDNWLTGDSAGTDSDILQDGTYVISYDGTIDDTVDDFSHDGTILYLDSSDNYYIHESAGNSLTPFRRLVTVVDNTANIDITVEVRWSERGRDHDYKIDARLYDWW